MPLQNYVILEPGKPERVHFSDHHLERREISDPKTGRPTFRNVCVFDVDEVNGLKTPSQLSVISEKLFASLEPYLPGKEYLNYDFTITKVGAGFTTSFSVQVTPRK